MTTANDRRIARNSAFLYVRMLLTIGISLYTSRVVLEMLGVDNFGIYNVVGSIVTIFAFLNGTMAGATQRFLNYEMGRGNDSRLHNTFGASFLIHCGIALLVLIAGETIGLWLVNERLVIDPTRMYAANYAFQLSLLACMCTIVQVPYMAAIIAHERMDALAVITLVSTILKLGVALSLAFAGSWDTLILYAWLMLAVSAVTMLAYILFARNKFAECRISGRVPRDVIKGILGFSASDIFGNLCYSLRLQSIPYILNRFGGAALNAAVGLNLTVSGAITQFGTTILSAFRPQIIQQYAGENLAYMQRLMANCAKYSLLMVSLIAVPAIICMDFLLSIWLVEVPAYTATFCRLTIIAAAAELVIFTINCGIHATGHIARMSIITGVIYLLEIPSMWGLLWLTHRPWVVYAVHIAVMLILIATVSIILKRQMPQYAPWRFFVKGVITPAAIVAPAAGIAYIASMCLGASWLHLLTVTALSSIVMGSLAWKLAIDSDTRHEILVRLKIKKHTPVQ